jgi:hypothetical protein
MLFNRHDKGYQYAKGGPWEQRRSFISSGKIKRHQLSRFVGLAGTIRLEWEELGSKETKSISVSTLFHVIDSSRMNTDIAIGTGWDDEEEEEEEEQPKDDEEQIEASDSDEESDEDGDEDDRHDSSGMLQRNHFCF